MSKPIVITITFVVLVVGLLFFVQKAEMKDPIKYDEFAKCVAKAEFTMYGAYWCSHCQNEKKRFGQSFQYVPYVECTENEKLCLDKGIRSYPTWMKPDGTKYEGELGLERIAEITGCTLPVESNE